MPRHSPQAPKPVPGPLPDLSRRAALLILLGILVVATMLRLLWLTQAPPGLNQDEAVNVFNAWSLYKTGQDQHGVPWPIFYYRALGGNSTTLYLYLTIPFVAIGGQNVWTSRLPSVVAGVLTVWLLYWLAARLFNRRVGLVAAALLTLSSWHIQLSRWGHEAILAPLVACLALASLLWAGFPICNAPGRPRLWRALLAGLAIGVSCYGYGSIRLFLPLLVAGCAAVNPRAWWNLARTRAGLLALGGLLLGLALTFGPLAYSHIAYPEGVGQRGERTWIWEPNDAAPTKLTKIVGRYFGHFGPDFLFISGDRFEMQSAAGFGMLSWYHLPLMLVGLGATIRNARCSIAARLLLAWFVLYPVGDSFNRHILYEAPDGSRRNSLHALRSAGGLVAPVMLSAVGAVAAVAWLGRVQPGAARAAGVVIALAALALDARFVMYYFGPHLKRPIVRYRFHADLMEALAWLRPRAAHADAVFITATHTNMPYMLTLVALDYDPAQWRRDEKASGRYANSEWEYYTRFGKFHFLYDAAGFNALRQRQYDARRERVIVVARPNEVPFSNPALTIRDPFGNVTLVAHELEL